MAAPGGKRKCIAFGPGEGPVRSGAANVLGVPRRQAWGRPGLHLQADWRCDGRGGHRLISRKL
eukprot:10425422-Alexandrium_andersonii.AAC.1